MGNEANHPSEAKDLQDEMAAVLNRMEAVGRQVGAALSDVQAFARRISLVQQEVDHFSEEYNNAREQAKRHQEMVALLRRRVAALSGRDDVGSTADAGYAEALRDVLENSEGVLPYLLDRMESARETLARARQRNEALMQEFLPMLEFMARAEDEVSVLQEFGYSIISALIDIDDDAAHQWQLRFDGKIAAYKRIQDSWSSYGSAWRTLEKLTTRPDRRSTHVNDLIHSMRHRRLTGSEALELRIPVHLPSSGLNRVSRLWATGTDSGRLERDQKEIGQDFREAVLRILAEEHPKSFLRAASIVLESGKHLEVDASTLQVLGDAIRRAQADEGRQSSSGSETGRPRLRSVRQPKDEEAS